MLSLLDAYEVEIEEYDVPEELIGRLNASALTRRDIHLLDSSRPVQPNRLYDYIYTDHRKRKKFGGLHREFPHVIPFAIVDFRIEDLAITFWKNPDEKLMTGYRRLEDIVRSRTGADEHGAKLFSTAFAGPSSKLRWMNIDGGEQTGRASLFTGAYMAYRNPRAHRVPKNSADTQLAEFLLLNQLYLLEEQAIDRDPEPEVSPAAGT